MSEPVDRGAVNALGAYWDWLNSGDGSPPPVDDASARTIAELVRLDGRRTPSAAFVRALEAELTNAPRVTTRARPLLAARAGRRRPSSPAAHGMPAGARRGWSLLQGVATAIAAALIVASVAGMLLALRGDGSHRPTEPAPGVSIPAPSPAATATAVERRVLLDRTGVETPAEYNWLGVSRVTIAPGATYVTGALEDWSGAGPEHAYVDSGAVTVTTDGAARWQAAAEAAETELRTGTGQRVDAGGRVVVPLGVRAMWTNAGTSDAVLLLASAVYETDAGESLPAGVTVWQGIYTVTPLPPGPLDLRVERVTLPPGAAVGGEPGPGLRMIGVESGAIEVTWARPDAPGVATGKPFAVTAPGTLDIDTDRFYALAITNRSNAPAVILIFTATATATAGGGEGDTPDAG